MLFVKPKGQGKAAKGVSGASESGTPDGGPVEVLPAKDATRAVAASRGLFVRPARDVEPVEDATVLLESERAAVSAENPNPEPVLVDVPEPVQPDEAPARDPVPSVDPKPVRAGGLLARLLGKKKAAAASAPEAAPRAPKPIIEPIYEFENPADVAQARDTPDPGVRGRFQFSSDTRAPESGAPSAGPAVGRRSLFGKARKGASPDKADSASASEEGKTAGKRRRAARKGGAAAAVGSLVLITELEGSKSLFWALGPNSLQVLTQGHEGEAASFSVHDTRLATSTALGHGAATSLALSEVGEPVRIVNASKTAGAVYATRQSRVASFAGPIGPGVQLLDALLRRDGRALRNLVAGFFLKDEGGRTLALLYHVNDEGEIGALQATVNPENMEFTLAQYVASRRIAVDTHEVVLYDNADLLSVAGGLALYPREAIFLGLPASRLLRVTAAVMVAGALGAGGWAGTEYQRGSALESQAARLQADVRQLTAANGELLISALPSFAHALSLDTDRELGRAQSLWLPGTWLTLSATQSGTEYVMSMPVARSSGLSNRPSVARQLTVEELAELANFTPPEGCSRTGLSVKGTLNELQITVTCESADSGLSGYRLD